MQIIVSSPTLPWRSIDLSSLDEAAAAARLAEILARSGPSASIWLRRRSFASR